MRLQVETGGMAVPPCPTHFTLGARRMAVEVLDRWPGESYAYFKVRASDDNLYILRHDETQDVWELTLFRAEARD